MVVLSHGRGHSSLYKQVAHDGRLPEWDDIISGVADKRAKEEIGRREPILEISNVDDICAAMHFSKTYSQLLLTLPPDLRERVIEYRQLKKLINQIVLELTALGAQLDVFAISSEY